MKKADIDEDTDIFHLVIMGQSATELDWQFENQFKSDQYQDLGNEHL
jgi:hypothetical protein